MTVLFATEWPTEVWAVEYTNIRNERVVDVMDTLDAAQRFIEKVDRNYWAEPVLLRSRANFFPCAPDGCDPDHIAELPKPIKRQWSLFRTAVGIKRKYSRHTDGFANLPK
ncbi:hypothetical protein A5686_13320 [Mycobacterium sp. E2479]|nr:hypothetical protein A5686_13320 [Mycobacterium sp. E2479]